MAKVLSIANQKGGPGKTTTSHNLSYEFAMIGKRVLAIDMDGQGNLTTLLGLDKNDLELSIASLLGKNADCDIKDLIIKTQFQNLDLIPSNKQTYFAEKELANRSGREFILNDELEKIKNDYDIIVLDTPPNLGLLTFSSLIASDYVLIAVTSAPLALEGIADILETFDEIKENKRIDINNVKILGAIHNNYKISNKIMNEYAIQQIESVKDDIPRVFGPIRSTTELDKAHRDSKPMSLYDPKHKISSDYKRFAREVLECL
jgi:chromosome partitioning protein